MKVAVITDYFPISSHPWNGHSAYQTLRLLARDCDLHVFYPEAAYPASMTPPSSKANTVDRGWNPPDVRATYIPYPVLPVLTRSLNGLSSAQRLTPHVRRFQPDVILNYSVYPYGVAAVRIGRALRVPVMLTAIGSDLNRPADALCARQTRSALRTAAFVATVSHDLCRTALALGADPGRTRAILNGCDTSIFHPRDPAQSRLALGLAPDSQVVLYVGRLDLRKGLLELIEAMASLWKRHPGARCYIVGDGPARQALQDAIATHGISHAVVVVPAVPTQAVALWMGAASLVTLPSYAEGSPNVVIEALSAGRPVVATSVGGIPELTSDASGRLVPPRNAAALIQALDQTLSSSWNAQAISDSHNRSWADVAADVLAVLRELAAK